MIKVIDFSAIRELLHRDGVQSTLSGLSEYILADFARWDEFVKSSRLATHYSAGVIELMPISDRERYSFKYVNGHPGNPRQGKQTVVAVGMLADVETGYPLLLSEMTVLTALRTAATSSLVARFCARSDSSSLAMIGAGTQAAFQALALANELPVSELRCFDLQPRAIHKLHANLREYGLDVVACASIEEAVRGADVVTTATAAKRHQRILTPAHVQPGMHINAIGGDCPGKTELDPEILATSRVIVEYEPQTRIEGEMQQLSDDAPVIELWELATGRAPGRLDAAQVTVFDSVGFALEDYSVLRYVMDRAQALGLGYESALIPDLSPESDLFGTVTAAPRSGAQRRGRTRTGSGG